MYIVYCLYTHKCWFFSGSVRWLRCNIAPLPYKQPVKPLYNYLKVI